VKFLARGTNPSFQRLRRTQGSSVRSAILQIPDTAWVQAINSGGEDRDGAWIAEVTDDLDLSAWPEGSRLICRRERPHPGAQFTIFDERGYRHTCFLTDQPGENIAQLELRHRGRARVEDRIRAAKDTGMRNLPHHAFGHNQTWLELSLTAQDLLTWTKLICLTGELATAEPKRLRHRLLAHRRPHRQPRPPHPPTPPSRLAMGTTTRRRVAPPTNATLANLNPQLHPGHTTDTTPTAPARRTLPKTRARSPDITPQPGQTTARSRSHPATPAQPAELAHPRPPTSRYRRIEARSVASEGGVIAKSRVAVCVAPQLRLV
jgi:hypothetical protein